MRTQFIQIGRFGNFLLFLFLEIVAFYLVISFNQDQRTIFMHSASVYTAEVNEKYTEFRNYLSLKEINDSLAASNARIRNGFPYAFNYTINKTDTISIVDSTQLYTFTSSKIISYTTSLRNNTMVINKGKNNGLSEGMGVIDDRGIIGITKKCTEHFCSLIPIIHSKSIVSAKVLPSNYFGNLVWTSNNPNLLELNAIPKHAQVDVGDTVVTSGYSHVFPPGIMVGTVENVHLAQGSNFYSIKVQTVNDLNRLNYVYVVKNLMKAELDSLQNTGINEE